VDEISLLFDPLQQRGAVLHMEVEAAPPRNPKFSPPHRRCACGMCFTADVEIISWRYSSQFDAECVITAPATDETMRGIKRMHHAAHVTGFSISYVQL
jgi:hypothetical protein